MSELKGRRDSRGTVALRAALFFSARKNVPFLLTAGPWLEECPIVSVETRFPAGFCVKILLRIENEADAFIQGD